MAIYLRNETVTFRAEAAGLPRWTVIFFGMMTRSSTRGIQERNGFGPLPPSPVKRLWGGMTMGTLGVSRISSVSGIISGWASVTCPGKTCTPWMRTVR